jgi:hypothetical protein
MFTRLGLVTLLVVLTAAPAFAITATVDNQSDRCAWITYRTAGSFLAPWSNVASGAVKAHSTKEFTFGAKPEVQVQAEIKHNLDCGGGDVSVIKDTKKNVMEKHYNADAKIVVWVPHPKYEISFKTH